MVEKEDPIEVKTMLWVQQGLITAMIAARFDPAKFEQNIAAVRGTMKLAAISDAGYSPGEQSAQEQVMDDMFDLYVRMFRAGDVNA